jgi:hypothetical protein
VLVVILVYFVVDVKRKARRRLFFPRIMNVKDPFHITRICRLCLLGDGTMPIFSNNDVEVSLKQKISICLSFEVSTIRII